MASDRKIKGFWFVRISQRKPEIYTKGMRVLEQEGSSHRSDIGEPLCGVIGLPWAGVWVLESQAENPVSRLRD